MDSTSSSRNRQALPPQRKVGRQRVAELIDAAAAVIQERGFEATTMAEIAARAKAKIGSLYRFFPSKDAIADALMEHQAEILQAEYDSVRGQAAGATPEELADILIDLLVKLHPQTQGFSALLDSRTDRTVVRRRFRAQTLAGVKTALTTCAPGLDDREADDIAAVVLNNMKIMVGMMTGQAPTSAGAPDQLRLMTRLYLTAKLAPARSR